jgi:hypothetical protein
VVYLMAKAPIRLVGDAHHYWTSSLVLYAPLITYRTHSPSQSVQAGKNFTSVTMTAGFRWVYSSSRGSQSHNCHKRALCIVRGMLNITAQQILPHQPSAYKSLFVDSTMEQ